MERNFETVMIEQCAPVLAGLKACGTFPLRDERLRRPCPPRPQLERTAGRKGALRPRPQGLCADPPVSGVRLPREQAPRCAGPAAGAGFLCREGYTLPEQSDDYGPLLRQLSRRLCCEADFPHEIGVFLGYPLYDVVGFIENAGRNFTCCGCWKAYGDPNAAQQHFAQLNKCTAVYLRLFRSGTPIQRLAVAA